MNENVSFAPACAEEGALYKSVTVYGRTFDLYYGYYEEYERNSVYNEPVPIYPDLAAFPVYSDDGYRLVTEMQAACDRYTGNAEESICYGCAHFERGEELFGRCLYEMRKGLSETPKTRTE